MITASDAHALTDHFNRKGTFSRIDLAIRIAAMCGESSVEIHLNESECHHFRDIKAKLLSHYFLSNLDHDTHNLYIQW